MNAPKKWTFFVSLILVVFSVLCKIGGILPNIPFLTENSYWVGIVGYALLFLGCIFKGL